MRSAAWLSALLAVPSAAAPPLPYRDAALPVPARVADLLSRMTFDEKIAQLFTRETGDMALLLSTCSSTGIGQANIGFASGSTPADYIEARNKIQAKCLQNRLGIPTSFFHEGLHTGGRGGTLFPEPLLTACAFNSSLVASIGAALSFEARGAGVDNTWSPVVNMWVDDRFGRFQEGFSPDPMITSTLSRALVIGAQGGVSGQDDYLPGGSNVSTWSTAKHFCGCVRLITPKTTSPTPHATWTLTPDLALPRNPNRSEKVRLRGGRAQRCPLCALEPDAV